MEALAGLDAYLDYGLDLGIEILSLYLYCWVYYRRYYDRDAVVFIALLSLFLFVVVITLTLSDFNLASGFALFALLSIISLRSESLAKVKTSYVFGAIALGVINGAAMEDYVFLLMINPTLILGAWGVEGLPLFPEVIRIPVVLEEVPLEDLHRRERIVPLLEHAFAHPVLYYEVEKVSLKKNIPVEFIARIRPAAG